MIYWKYPMGLCVLACSLSISAASGQQLNPQQIQLIRDTAASICNTVKDTKGQKTDLQLARIMREGLADVAQDVDSV